MFDINAKVGAYISFKGELEIMLERDDEFI
jgi:hypothetical protein